MADISKIKTPDGTYNIKDTTKLPLAGGTMTGQIKTSFNSSVATGSYCATASTIPNLCTELRYSSGVMGSVSISADYTKDGVTIPARWYNFLWIPHRSGGINGQASGDNCDYGSLLLSAMTGSGLGVYALHYFNGSINTLEDLTKDTNTTYALSTSGNNVVLTPSSGSANTITVPYATSAGSASTATTASYSNYPNIVAGNEIRFNVNTKPSSATDLHIGYAWSDGAKDAKINSYRFENGNMALTKVYASEFNGALVGNVTGNCSGSSGSCTGNAATATSATTASKLGSSNVGSATNPIYLNGGTATACTYSLNKTVPSNAVFTDTNNAVTQTFTTSATGKHEILFANAEDDTTTTEGVLKTDTLSFRPNPSSSSVAFDVGLPGVSISGSKYAMGGYGQIYVWKSGVLNPVISLNGDNGKITCNSMNVQDISSLYTFSKTGGHWTYQGIRAVRSGNVVTMQIIIKGGSSVSAGSNGITGTFSGGPLPARINNGTEDMGVQGVNFYGVSALVGTLNSSGAFTLRLLINNQSLGSNTTSVSFTFVCD